MSDEKSKEINERDLANLRSNPDAVAVIVALLGGEEMRPEDHDRTRTEVKEYVETGDVHEAHALIQHAKTRRDLWERESEIVNFPESETV